MSDSDVETERIKRFRERLARDTREGPVMVTLGKAAVDHAAISIDALIARNQQLTAERQRIAQILRTFAESPITMSALQPVLSLAEEMNR